LSLAGPACFCGIDLTIKKPPFLGNILNNIIFATLKF
jgi:hypothetical protein